VALLTQHLFLILICLPLMERCLCIIELYRLSRELWMDVNKRAVLWGEER
jgi:hypothetical protein